MTYGALLLATLLAGLVAAWSWTRCIHAVQQGKAAQAAMFDAIIVLSSTVVTLTIWSHVQNDPWVLVVWTLGNAAGTYWTVRSS